MEISFFDLASLRCPVYGYNDLFHVGDVDRWKNSRGNVLHNTWIVVGEFIDIYLLHARAGNSKSGMIKNRFRPPYSLVNVK